MKASTFANADILRRFYVIHFPCTCITWTSIYYQLVTQYLYL